MGSISMTSGRLGIPIEEFVNVSELHEPEDQHQIQSNWSATAFRRLSNCVYPRMDLNQQKIACGIIVGVAIFSTTLGFLSMFAIGQSSLSMMSRLNRNPIEDEKFITEEIFERINTNWFEGGMKFLSFEPHPGGQSRDNKIIDWIKKRFK